MQTKRLSVVFIAAAVKVWAVQRWPITGKHCYCSGAGVGRLRQPSGDGFQTVGLPGDAAVQQPSRLPASCLHCSDDRWRDAHSHVHTHTCTHTHCHTHSMAFFFYCYWFPCHPPCTSCHSADAGFLGLLSGLPQEVQRLLPVGTQRDPSSSAGLSHCLIIKTPNHQECMNQCKLTE